MADKECGCGAKHEGSCQSCRVEDVFGYFCETCKRSVAEKRCPYCGLKTKKKKA